MSCKVYLFVNQVERITTLVLSSIEASLEGMVEYNTVLIDLENFGFNQKNVIDVIQEFLTKGVLLEPKPGKLAKVG